MKLGNAYIAFVVVFMSTSNHKDFIDFLEMSEEVLEAHRISGGGCYILKVIAKTELQLNEFLDQVLTFGNYRLNLSIGIIK